MHDGAITVTAVESDTPTGVSVASVETTMLMSLTGSGSEPDRRYRCVATGTAAGTAMRAQTHLRANFCVDLSVCRTVSSLWAAL